MNPDIRQNLPLSREPLFERLGGRDKISQLMHHFYADVRQHREIGPIFNAQIDDWPEHLEKIGNFWSTATGGPRLYQGAMPVKHIPLGLQAEHFQAWLDLWRRNCRIHLPPAEAEEMIRLAETIGKRLHFIVTHHAKNDPV